MNADRRRREPAGRERCPDARGLGRIDRNAQGRRRAHDAERAGQAKHSIHLVLALRASERHRAIDGPRRPFVDEPDDVLRGEQAREPKRTGLIRGGREDHALEAPTAQLEHKSNPLPGKRERARVDVLTLPVGVHRIQVRVPGEDRGVVAVRQHREPGLGKALAQRGEKRGGADEIADVVASDDEDPRRVVGHRRGRRVSRCADRLRARARAGSPKAARARGEGRCCRRRQTR